MPFDIANMCLAGFFERDGNDVWIHVSLDNAPGAQVVAVSMGEQIVHGPPVFQVDDPGRFLDADGVLGQTQWHVVLPISQAGIRTELLERKDGMPRKRMLILQENMLLQ